MAANDYIDSINLEGYLKKNGFEKDKIKSSQNQLVYKNETERLLILRHKTSGQTIYQNLNDSNDKGNIINFVVNRINGYLNTAAKSKQDYAKAFEKLKNESAVISYTSEKKHKQEKVVFEYELYKPVPIKDDSLLVKRNISPETIHHPLFEGHIVNCWNYSFKNKKNYGEQLIGFPLYNQGKIDGLDMRDVDKKRLAFASNKAETFWMSNYNKSHENLFVSESPIDALSYFEIKGDSSTTYITTGGSISEIQINKINSSIEKGVYKTLTLGNDNDLGGYKNDIKIIASFLPEEKYKIVTSDRYSMTVFEEGKEIRLEELKEFKSHINQILYKYNLGSTIYIDKPSEKDWNQELAESKKKINAINITPKNKNTMDIQKSKEGDISIATDDNKFNSETIENSLYINKTASTPLSQDYVQSKKGNEDSLDDKSNIVNGVKLSQKEKEQLDTGYRVYLEKMNINGYKQSGYVAKNIDVDGKSINYVEKTTDKLVLNNKILGKALSEKDKEDLENGLAIKIEPNKNAAELSIQYDKNKNNVTIKTSHEIDIPDVIGKYKLTNTDKDLLNKGEKMPPRIFEGKEGYFIATVGLTEGRTGLEFNGVRSLKKEEAKELIASYNKDNGTIGLSQNVNNVIEVGAAVLDVNKKTELNIPTKTDDASQVVEEGIKAISDSKEKAVLIAADENIIGIRNEEIPKPEPESIPKPGDKQLINNFHEQGIGR